MATTQSPEFQKAVEDSRKLAKKPGSDELLQLYSLFKIGSGEDISKASKPGMLDLTGKAKYGAWQKAVDDGTTPEDAQKKYVELVESLKTKYGYEG